MGRCVWIEAFIMNYNLKSRCGLVKVSNFVWDIQVRASQSIV